jgi:hypothetical protein
MPSVRQRPDKRAALPEPASLRQAIGELLDRSDERDVYNARIKAAWSEGWLVGHQIGYDGGYGEAQRDMARRWHEVADPAARGGPQHAELQRRRWMLRGDQRTRGTFGQGHPDDFPGGDAA